MNDTKVIVGNFSCLNASTADGEYLNMAFQPNSIPLKQRWRNNGLSADFLGDYVTTFFPKVDDVPETATRQAEIQAAVSYVANELLENGMKYSDINSGVAIGISLFLFDDHIIITEVNPTSAEQSKAYKDFVDRLSESDPMEMFMEQLEAKAMDDSSSGLGFLTMINDYGAELSWQFDYSSGGDVVTITSEVRIPV